MKVFRRSNWTSKSQDPWHLATVSVDNEGKQEVIHWEKGSWRDTAPGVQVKLRAEVRRENEHSHLR